MSDNTNNTTTSVELNAPSASKVFSHVLKHPHSDVSGVLLTSSSPRKDDAKHHHVVVLDAIPLFHCESIDASAMNEIALAQTHKYARSKNMSVCGMYFANGNFNNNGEKEKLPDRAKGLADAIENSVLEEEEGKRRHVPIHCLLLDAGKLKSFVESSRSTSTSSTLAPFRVFSSAARSDGSGAELKERADIPARVVPSSLERRFDRNVADFDDHFDDVSKDWRNTT